MQDVIDLATRAHLESRRLNDELAAQFGISVGDPHVDGLNIANKYAIITLELLSFYKKLWGQVPPGVVFDPERARQENFERVMTANKAAFILSLSGFEFSAKQALIQRPGKIPPLQGRIYLGRIIGESNNVGLLQSGDEVAWKGLIALRNALVHNNGIAERTETYSIPGGPQIQLAAGQMPQGNLRFFIELFMWSIEAYGRWCSAYLT